MTRIKLCGLSRPQDIQVANELEADYIGFVFWEKSARRVSPEQAAKLKRLVSPRIRVVGVFVDAPPEQVAGLLLDGVIDVAQLHGHEEESYLRVLRGLAPGKPILQAFQIRDPSDVRRAGQSSADGILLDSGYGTGKSFDWDWIREIDRDYFLAGGLNPENVATALDRLHPFGIDVSSGIEAEGHKGLKDPGRMRELVRRVRDFDGGVNI